MYAPPRPVGQGNGLPRLAPPRKKEALPRPTPPCENFQNLWGAAGKVDFNPLKFGRQLQGRIQFCPINIFLTHKSVDVGVFTSTEWTGGGCRQDDHTIPTH